MDLSDVVNILKEHWPKLAPVATVSFSWKAYDKVVRSMPDVRFLAWQGIRWANMPVVNYVDENPIKRLIRMPRTLQGCTAYIYLVYPDGSIIRPQAVWATNTGPVDTIDLPPARNPIPVPIVREKYGVGVFLTDVQERLHGIRAIMLQPGEYHIRLEVEERGKVWRSKLYVMNINVYGISFN